MVDSKLSWLLYRYCIVNSSGVRGRVRYLQYQRVFWYSGILPVMPGRGPRYPELADRERGRGRGVAEGKIFRFCMVLSAMNRGIGGWTGRVGAFSRGLPGARKGGHCSVQNFWCVFRVYGVRMGVGISI
jgi:hypothetical protein